MKKTIQFSKFFLFAAVLSVLLVSAGIAGYFIKGFTYGVDFKSGLIQEIAVAPTAFSLKWNGTSRADLSFSSNDMSIVITGSGIENQTFSFPFSQYTTISSLANAMNERLEDLEIDLSSSVGDNASTQWLVFSSYGNPRLNDETPFVIHYLNPALPHKDISEIRAALAGVPGVSVQNIGDVKNCQFMIRAESNDDDTDGGRQLSRNITQALETSFGEGEIAVLRSDYVHKRFSAFTLMTSIRLLLFTLFAILIYASIRFKPVFAVGAVLAIIHDGCIVVSFVIWTQMEFTTSIIAAILTILGYSINNTIVVYDRIRENRKLYPDNSFTDIMNISLTNVLGRTIITTLTTILAVSFLFVFAKGSMKDFALALIVGMISGVYTTLFISTGFVNLVENMRNKKNVPTN